MEAKGINGSLVLGKGYIEIKREGLKAFLYHGIKGNKKLAIKQISAIQYKEPGFMKGFIQFTLIGGKENTGSQLSFLRKSNIEHDENTITFNKKQQPKFEKIKQEVEKIIYS